MLFSNRSADARPELGRWTAKGHIILAGHVSWERQQKGHTVPFSVAGVPLILILLCRGISLLCLLSCFASRQKLRCYCHIRPACPGAEFFPDGQNASLDSMVGGKY